jgi:hypothetical protein
VKRKLRTALLLAATLALVSLLTMTAGGCGSSQDNGGTGGKVELKSYTSEAYGFTFQYPKDWKLQEGAAAEITAGSGAKASVGVFDPKGAKAGDKYIDMMQTAVYELKVSIDESMMPDVKTELEGVLAQLEAQSPDMKMQGDLTQTTVNGMPGFMVTYTFDQDGEPATSTLYFLFDGAIEYQVTVQAATKNWQSLKPLFDTMVASFKPGASK